MGSHCTLGVTKGEGLGLLGVVGQGPPHCRELRPGAQGIHRFGDPQYDGARPGPGAFTPGWCWSLGRALFGGGWAVSIPADRPAPPRRLNLYRWGPCTEIPVLRCGRLLG